MQPLSRNHLEPEFATVEDAREIHVEHGLPLLERHLGDRPITQDSRVVHEDIETAPLFLDRTHHGGDRFGAKRTSAPQTMALSGRSVFSAAARRSASARVAPSPSSGWLMATRAPRAVKSCNDCGADALRSAGDERDLPRKVDFDGHDLSR